MHPIIYGVLLLTVSNVLAFELEIEGSGEVCNVQGSTCPEDNCCRKEICEKHGKGILCCENPHDNSVECATCPMCGESYYSNTKMSVP